MALGIVRFAGNLAVAAFFSADKDKKRHEKREDYKTALGDSKNDPGAGSCLPNKSICLYNRPYLSVDSNASLSEADGLV